MANDPFTITAPPGTDIWRKPPSTNSFNAPTHGLLPNDKPVPLKSFQRARVTFSGPWTTQYDQGGLLLHVTDPDGEKQDRWLKTGVEFYRARPYLSTVATLAYADWSITPPSNASAGAEVTVEVRRETDELGTSLWVYEVAPGSGEEVPLREVAWWFAEEGEGWVVDVRAVAARPAKKEAVVGAEGLVVSFSGAEVEVK